MGFYDLDKEARSELAARIGNDIASGLQNDDRLHIHDYFSNSDTYIRKTAYLAVGRIYNAHRQARPLILKTLELLLKDDDHKVRQTAINSAGEIGKSDFGIVRHFFDTGLFDEHHSVRNAVIGSMKKMGEKNPAPVIGWSRAYLHHPDKEVRREICHGIELRGRTHPGDILPLLRELQFDMTKRVRWTLVHVIGQVSYKKGCLETVLHDLATWDNKELVADALYEIISVHHRYHNFAWYTQVRARQIIQETFGMQID